MGVNTAASWIVCYDMADPRRLARIFKLLKAHGIPLQYSVFLIEASSQEMAQLEEKICQLINRTEDDVRVYRLPAGPHRVILGQPLIPAGILIDCGVDAW